MTTRGKSINLFLMDGEANGRIKCSLANWTGVAYRIPRTELERCKGRDDLAQSGVYFLFGTSEDNGDDVVYVGQAGVRKNGEGILYRLQEHKRDTGKDYWTEAVVFTTSNNSFGPTEISYLENRFCGMAKEANRYQVKNSVEPTPGNITEEKESELEEFIDYAKIVMGVLGHKVFEKLIETRPLTTPADILTNTTEETLLFLRRNSKKSQIRVDAQCRQTAEGFVVLKGSRIEPVDSESIPVGVKERRHKATLGDDGVLNEDVLFQSPSSAASFVVGGHTNGWLEWKNAEGKTLNDIEKGKAAKS